MNCMETVARLHLYIDRELSVEEVAIVQQHLTSCPSCECRFHFDLKITRLLHEKCAVDKAPGHLREAVLRLAHDPSAYELDPEMKKELRAVIDEDIDER
ncbi:MAG TPA: zf-HC2 domain-containing protein [Ktedonobacteraceae bacterium]|nr:zf-HC2 domain-containing protein [Ktedonobacteraceae bacterium]